MARAFEPPRTEYGPGHRGVDLVASPGDEVLAVADGVVRFAGTVGSVGVVSVEHDGVVSTYQPVAPRVGGGDRVSTGEPLGRLLRRGSHCAPRACLHLGRRIGDGYADPLALIGGTAARIRLMSPIGPPPAPPAPSIGLGHADGLRRPVGGPVTSPYGMRVHPLTGVFKLHDGTDLAAACGTPVHAAASGSVTARYFNAGYGNRVLVDHGTSQGESLGTSYNHLAKAVVRPGDRVERGEVVGYVGQTGYATGCHLHFMVVVGGEPVDPSAWL